MKKSILLFLGIWGSLCGFTQDSDLPLNHSLYQYYDRLDIKGYTEETVHTQIKPFGRKYLSETLDKAYISDMSYWEKQWHERAVQLTRDEAPTDSIKPVLKYFFRNGRDLVHIQTPKVKLFVNPALYLSGGLDQHDYFSTGSESQLISNNSRGLVVRGSFYDKLGFYTELYDNVVRYPQFAINRYFDGGGTLPGETFVKQFQTVNNGFDYFHSRAYLTFSPLPQMRIKFGQDRAFWGNGFQSLLLSDYAPNHLMLQINTKIWKLEYTNYFAQMVDFIERKPDFSGTHPRKYAVFHMLSYNPFPTLSIGVFESIVYTPNLANGQRGFELQYMNPIIFYRSVEQSLGSPDNSFLGFSAKLNLFKRLQFYGQFLLDDFNFGIRSEGSGYWGNKVGYQAGLKWVDAFGVSTLDLQAEMNRIRPYTYQHFNTSSNYTHYGQYLGHASGANLTDYTAVLRYHPRPAWDFYFRYSRMKKGLDENETNYGGDIFQSTSVGRPDDFGNTVGQGQSLEVQNLVGKISYQLFKTDIYAEIEGMYRTDNTVNSIQVMGGIRANLATRRYRY